MYKGNIFLLKSVKSITLFILSKYGKNLEINMNNLNKHVLLCYYNIMFTANTKNKHRYKYTSLHSESKK